MTRLIVLSLDALGAEDADLFYDLPHIGHVLRKGAWVPRVRSVMPTLTYPAHATILTGRSPGNHGIVNNHKLQPGHDEPDWFWYEKSIRGDTLFRAAKRNGDKVGAVLWPVNAGARIHRNVAEIWAHRPWHTQHTVSLAHSTPRFLLTMAKRYGHLLRGKEQPHLDNFAHACALELLEEDACDLLFVHYTDIDAHKHKFGNRHAAVTEAVKRTDQRVGEILTHLHLTDAMETTNLVLLSDHSQRDIEQALRLNQYFYRYGYLQARGDSVHRWRAVAFSCGGSAYIYTKGMNGTEIDGLRNLLETVKEQTRAIDRIGTNAEAVALGGDPACTFFVTGMPGVVFSNRLTGELFGDMDDDYRANHGFPPDLPNYEAFFAGMGPAFQTGGVTVETTHALIDVAPTLAQAAGLPLQGAEGRPICGILR